MPCPSHPPWLDLSTSNYTWRRGQVLKLLNVHIAETYDISIILIFQSKLYLRLSERWLCSLLSVNRRFGGTYCLHLQGPKISWARNAWKRVAPWRLRRYVPPKRRLTLSGLHEVISQKMALFKVIFDWNLYLYVHTRFMFVSWHKDLFHWYN
jgi:hypothetical protein